VYYKITMSAVRAAYIFFVSVSILSAGLVSFFYVAVVEERAASSSDRRDFVFPACVVHGGVVGGTNSSSESF
jgi:hypothetical protein